MITKTEENVAPEGNIVEGSYRHIGHKEGRNRQLSAWWGKSWEASWMARKNSQLSKYFFLLVIRYPIDMLRWLKEELETADTKIGKLYIQCTECLIENPTV